MPRTPQDHLSAGGVDLGAAMRRQEEDQALMQRALETALHRPHTVHEHTMHACGVAEISPKVRAVIVALPSGEQHRIHLDPFNSRALAEALGKPFEAESEDAAEKPGS